MPLATALVTGNDPLPQLAEEAVAQALEKAGLTQASGVLLFLTPEFARQARQAVTAAARAAQCLQLAGGIASGVLTESGWALDRPAAAVMVFGEEITLVPPVTDAACLFSYSGGTFPPDWSATGQRFGGTFSGSFAGSAIAADPVVWQQGRPSDTNRCEARIVGAKLAFGVSRGLYPLGRPHRVERCNGFDLEALGGMSARHSLLHELPPELRTCPDLQPHHLTALLPEDDESPERALAEGRYRPIAIIAANADNSLTLAERIDPGQTLAWAVRQPVAAEADMQAAVDRLAQDMPSPAGALMFSCIGRGPYFYGGEDRDLETLRHRFPDLPILGAYGTGQIAPAGPARSQHLQNAVVTALIGDHAQ